ncbi:MAG: hypothetical protein AAGF90_24070 [Pseudomonadota bacterium]
MDDGVAEALRLRAARNGRSAEAERRTILREALTPRAEETADFAAAAARLRAQPAIDPEAGADGATLIRETRDERRGRRRPLIRRRDPTRTRPLPPA